MCSIVYFYLQIPILKPNKKDSANNNPDDNLELASNIKNKLCKNKHNNDLISNPSKIRRDFINLISQAIKVNYIPSSIK